ncbi:hypothetical protein EDC01DRAFT_659911 [Geopyxis carbonaria]|nr:hypothetical protein EDC01DRAFT_659911 [Geopyxis carbonaria]
MTESDEVILHQAFEFTIHTFRVDRQQPSVPGTFGLLRLDDISAPPEAGKKDPCHQIAPVVPSSHPVWTTNILWPISTDEATSFVGSLNQPSVLQNMSSGNMNTSVTSPPVPVDDGNVSFQNDMGRSGQITSHMGLESSKRHSDSLISPEGKPKRQRKSTAKGAAMQEENKARRRNTRLSTTVYDSALVTAAAPPSIPIDTWPRYQQKEDALPFQKINRSASQENNIQSDTACIVESVLNSGSADGPLDSADALIQSRATTSEPIDDLPELLETDEYCEKKVMQLYLKISRRYKVPAVIFTGVDQSFYQEILTARHSKNVGMLKTLVEEKLRPLLTYLWVYASAFQPVGQDPWLPFIQDKEQDPQRAIEFILENIVVYSDKNHIIKYETWRKNKRFRFNGVPVFANYNKHWPKIRVLKKRGPKARQSSEAAIQRTEVVNSTISEYLTSQGGDDLNLANIADNSYAVVTSASETPPLVGNLQTPSPSSCEPPSVSARNTRSSTGALTAQATNVKVTSSDMAKLDPIRPTRTTRSTRQLTKDQLPISTTMLEVREKDQPVAQALDFHDGSVRDVSNSPETSSKSALEGGEKDEIPESTIGSDDEAGDDITNPAQLQSPGVAPTPAVICGPEPPKNTCDFEPSAASLVDSPIAHESYPHSSENGMVPHPSQPEATESEESEPVPPTERSFTPPAEMEPFHSVEPEMSMTTSELGDCSTEAMEGTSSNTSMGDTEDTSSQTKNSRAPRKRPATRYGAKFSVGDFFREQDMERSRESWRERPASQTPSPLTVELSEKIRKLREQAEEASREYAAVVAEQRAFQAKFCDDIEPYNNAHDKTSAECAEFRRLDLAHTENENEFAQKRRKLITTLEYLVTEREVVQTRLEEHMQVEMPPPDRRLAPFGQDFGLENSGSVGSQFLKCLEAVNWAEPEPAAQRPAPSEYQKRKKAQRRKHGW